MPTEPSNEERRRERRRAVERRAGLLGWLLLSCVPVSVIALIVWSTLVRQRSVAAFIELLPATFGVGLIIVGCVIVIAEQRGRRRWWRRVGNACVRCGYEMPGRSQETCPECGLERAAVQPYESVVSSMSPGMKRVCAWAFWAVVAIVVVGVYFL